MRGRSEEGRVRGGRSEEEGRVRGGRSEEGREQRKNEVRRE